jgi:hypothetical protein
MLVVNPIQPKNTAIVGVLLFSDSLVTFSIIKNQFSVCSATYKISAFRTVSNVIDESSMRFIGFDKIVRRAFEAFEL